MLAKYWFSKLHVSQRDKNKTTYNVVYWDTIYYGHNMIKLQALY